MLADKSRRIENHEFFERQIVDSTTYGGNFGYRNDFVPVHLFFNNNSSTINRAFRPSQDYTDDEAGLSLSNDSKITGDSHLDFTYDRFSRTESDTPDQKGTSEDLNFNNQKYLTNDNKKLFSSYLNFYNLTGTSNSGILSLNEKLDIEHNDYLNSSYGYNFSDRSSAGIDTKDNTVNASIRHKLYESLTSSFRTYYSASDSETLSEKTYGLSLDEDYVKSLGKIGKLSAGLGLGYDQDRRDMPENVVSIIGESHTLTTGTITFLAMPGVKTETVVVTNSTGAITYVLNVDYQLIASGNLTQIQRIPAGNIANGQEVLVDYQTSSNPSFKFDTFTQNYSSRIDFLDNLLGLFYRINKQTHPNVSGEENAILETLTDKLFGADFNYKNFKIEFEDDDYNSNLSPYKRLRLTESYLLNPTRKSTLTFQSSQSRIRLINSQDTQKFFEFISRYTIRLTQNTRFNTEGGFRWQQGTGIDLNDVTERSSFELNLGKLEMNIEYDFEKQLYLRDALVNHYFYTKIRRTF